MKQLIRFFIFSAIVIFALQSHADTVRFVYSKPWTNAIGRIDVVINPVTYYGDIFQVDLFCAGSNVLPAGITVTDNAGDVFVKKVSSNIFSRWKTGIVRQTITTHIYITFPQPTTCLIDAQEIIPDTQEAAANVRGSLRDKYGNTWSFYGWYPPYGSGIYLNGVYTGGVGQAIFYSGGVMYTTNINGYWYYFNGINNWVYFAGSPNMTGTAFAAPYYGFGSYEDVYGNTFGFGAKVGTGNEYQLTVNGIPTNGVGCLLVRAYGLYATTLGADNNWYYYAGGKTWTSWGGFPTLGDLMVLSVGRLVKNK